MFFNNISYFIKQYNKIVLISGRAGAGKDTMAELLKNKLNIKLNKLNNKEIKLNNKENKEIKNFKNNNLNKINNYVNLVHFADKLKLYSYNVFKNFDKNITQESFYEKKNEYNNLINDTNRTILQFMGTEARKSINENIWIDNLDIKPGINIVPDHRFINERWRLEELYPNYHIFSVHINRENQFKNINYNHESEKSDLIYNYLYNNNKKIKDMDKWINKHLIDEIID